MKNLPECTTFHLKFSIYKAELTIFPVPLHQKSVPPAFMIQEQGVANYCQQLKSDLLPVFINKVLLDNSTSIHLHTIYLWLLLSFKGKVE